MGYMIHRKCIDDRKAEKLRENLHMIGEDVKRNHKIFVGDSSELDNFDVAKHFDTAPELVGRFFNRPKSETIEKLIMSNEKKTTAAEMVKAEAKRTQAYKELKSRTSRSVKLKRVIDGLALQRNLMGKGAKTKVPSKNAADSESDSGGKRKRNEEPTVYKWKRERKR
jgi:U3 small nucleolar RNA-associated protein 11